MVTIYEPDSGSAIVVEGKGYTAEEWKRHFQKQDRHAISDWAQRALSHPGYNRIHRLKPGAPYQVKFLFGREIPEDGRRTTEGLRKLARHKFGDLATKGLKGELAFLLREKITNKDLEKMGVSRIVILHRPILTYGGERCVFRIDRFDGVSSVGAESGGPKIEWGGGTAFAFFG